jgi:hypothetical protein
MRAFLVFAFALLSGCVLGHVADDPPPTKKPPWPEAGMSSLSDYPPPLYRGDAVVWAEFRSDAASWCAEQLGRDNVRGCYVQYANDPDVPVLFLVNPCDEAFQEERFARAVCHEMGHVNGWRHVEGYGE